MRRMRLSLKTTPSQPRSLLRIKAEKRGLSGLIVFIAELVLSRQESVISMVVERASGESDHVAQFWSDYS